MKPWHELPLPAPWRRLEAVTSTPSTQEAVVASAGSDSGVVVVAAEQTSGRGRLDRTWTSPPSAGLWFSALLRTKRPVADVGVVPLLSAVAIARTLNQDCGLTSSVKWPNDVLVNDAKIAGVLVQLVNSDSLVIGVGINTFMTHEQRPIATATSLAMEGVVGFDHPQLLMSLLGHLGELVGPIEAEGSWPSDVLDEYRALSSTVGREVAVHLPSGQTLSGLAVDLDPHGRLEVQGADGVVVTVGAGDVVHVR